MFIRKHRIGHRVYSEALESYRDPITRRPKHRLLARWAGDMSLAEAIAWTEKRAEGAQRQVVGWARVIENPRTALLHVSYRSRWARLRRAPQTLASWHRRLEEATAQLARLHLAAERSGNKRRDGEMVRTTTFAEQLDQARQTQELKEAEAELARARQILALLEGEPHVRSEAAE